MPSSPSRRAELDALIARPFAHRGLHGPGVPENSRAAFAAAIAAGHGIELDVQASRDGTAMVFHDADLDRLSEASGRVRARTREELGAIRLSGSAETIPSLGEILKLVAARVPLLIELKAPGWRADALSRAVEGALIGYGGLVAVMSFNPQVGAWFARRAPSRLRGLVVSEAGAPQRGRARRFWSVWRVRPDFLAYDIRDLPSSLPARQRAAGRPILTWTCRTEEDRSRAARHADQIIYETPG